MKEMTFTAALARTTILVKGTIKCVSNRVPTNSALDLTQSKGNYNVLTSAIPNIDLNLDLVIHAENKLPCCTKNPSTQTQIGAQLHFLIHNS